MNRARVGFAWLLCLIYALSPLALARELLLPESSRTALSRSVGAGQPGPVLEVQAQSRSGGGFGGGGSRSRSAPSIPRSSGGGSFGGGSSSRPSYTPPSRRSGGYSVPPVIVVPGGGGYYGPSYGGGGYRSSSSSAGDAFVGLLVLLVFVVIVGAVLFALWRAFARRGGGAAALATTSRALKVQIMMAEGDEVKRDLQEIAENGDSSSSEGLMEMLRNAGLSVLRHPDRWMYGGIEEVAGDDARTENQVVAWATEARSKFTDQTVSNYSGKRRIEKPREAEEMGGLYLVVTLIAAGYNLPSSVGDGVNAKQVRQAITALSSISPEDLVRLDVVWSPDQEGAFLSSDEALELYPSLTKL